MPLDDLQLDLINNHKRQNECYLFGIMENGKEGCAVSWLTDDEVENMCGQPSGVFTQVTRIAVRTRHLTREELAKQADKQPGIRVIHGPHYRVPVVVTVQ